MKRLAAAAVVGVLLVLPSASAAKSGCPTRDVRTMLAEAGQGMNGRVIALHETYITVVAESTYKRQHRVRRDRARLRHEPARRPAGPDRDRRPPPTVTAGPRAAATSSRAGGWPTPCAAQQPCPRPRVRISAVRIDGLVAHVTLLLAGDVTTLRLDSGQKVRRRQFSEPGIAMIVEDFTYSAPGQVPREGPRRGRLRAGLRHGPQALVHGGEDHRHPIIRPCNGSPRRPRSIGFALYRGRLRRRGAGSRQRSVESASDDELAGDVLATRPA